MNMTWPKATKAEGDAGVREQRISKLVTVEISNSRLGRTRVVVRNLSNHGLGIRSDVDLLPCERLTVHIGEDRSVEATVRWVGKGQFGLALDERVARLVKLGLAVGASAEGAVKSNARKALAAGARPEEIRQVGILAITTCGFPAAIAGLGWIDEVLEAG